MPDDVPPLWSGDWIASETGAIGRVKACYFVEGTPHADVVLYHRNGSLIGRESPPEGGPTSFEPAVPLEGWRRIARPIFPLLLRWVPCEDRPDTLRATWDTMERKPFRTVARKRPAVSAVRRSNFDPELEAKARRMAAQMLRDAAREGGDLVAAAARLEEEAARMR